VAVIETEDLRDVVLVGHSYGGMVVSGVVAALPDRIRRLIYLDAFVPRDGDSVLTLLPPEMAVEMRDRVVDGWRLPPNPLPADTPQEDVAWLVPRRAAQPFATFTQPLAVAPPQPPPRAYIYCTRLGPVDVFGPFAQRARREPGWAYREIDASHSPHITAPAALVGLLLELAEPLTAGPERAAGI
jgi:pimeloyl-ACP methyl ester carboxylesterase